MVLTVDNPSTRFIVDPNTFEGKDELNVLDYRVDNTGHDDCTAVLQALHRSGKRIYYPNGMYRFNGDSLDFSGGVRFESTDGVVIRNRISEEPIVRFDDLGNLIGLMQNHMEYNEMDLGRHCGSLVEPPMGSPKPTDTDIMVYWYNDFGLQAHYTMLCGWLGWHYWSWNHHDVADNRFYRNAMQSPCDPYDPSRHPLLGFYYGDDPVVLDWQSYWLTEYGVRSVSLLASPVGWENPSNHSHWAYQLFHHAKNFKNLTYSISGPVPCVERGSRPCVDEKQRDDLVRHYDRIIEDIYAKFDNRMSLYRDGREYPVLSLLGENHVNGVFDNHDGVEQTLRFYEYLASRMQEFGFGGITLFCVFPQDEFDAPEVTERLRRAGVIRKKSSYVPWHIRPDWATCGSYRAAVESYAPPADPDVILGIGSAMHTHTPHESRWNCPGNTPELFEEFLGKALAHLDGHPDMERIITCYNLSEWAEGGAGIQPNVQDGFGYLNAIRNQLLTKRKN